MARFGRVREPPAGAAPCPGRLAYGGLIEVGMYGRIAAFTLGVTFWIGEPRLGMADWLLLPHVAWV